MSSKVIINVTSFFKDRWRDEKEPILYIFSLTLLLSSILKFNKEEKERSKMIKMLNNGFFLFSIILSASLIVLTELVESTESYRGFVNNSSTFNILLYFVLYYSWSRVSEVFVAFPRDIYKRLSQENSGSDLKYYERISLAVHSYIELILLYGIMYYISSFNDWGIATKCESTLTAWQAIYFSGVTITTLGYGDYSPSQWFPQFLSVFEVINGFSLIIISFTVYVSMSIEKKEYKPLTKDNDKAGGTGD